MPNPDSAIEALSYRVSKVILLYNHSHTERYPLTLAVSDDYGNTWKPLFDLETKSGEFPSATMDSLGVIHVTYAYMPEGKIQRRIKHIVLSLNEN